MGEFLPLKAGGESVLEGSRRDPELSILVPAAWRWSAGMGVISTQCLHPLFFLHDAQCFTALSSRGTVPRTRCDAAVMGEEQGQEGYC